MPTVRHLSVLAAVLALGGCAPGMAPRDFADGTPAMRPETFFAGATHADGILENRSGVPTGRVRVLGAGRTLPDGSFRLDQTVTIDDAKPTTRTWLIRRVDDHRYLGTLTDAAGPVRAEAYGNLFHVRYPMKRPIGGEFEEWMLLQPDGRTVMNQSTVFVFGLVGAHFMERIGRGTP